MQNLGSYPKLRLFALLRNVRQSMHQNENHGGSGKVQRCGMAKNTGLLDKPAVARSFCYMLFDPPAK
jgi:hypothetical protein